MSAPSPDLSTRTAVVTGATSGIGSVTAREIARLGATVWIVARSEEKAKQTVDEIRRATGNDRVDFLLADLATQKEIRRVAGEILERCPALHLLVNNAGIVNLKRKLTVDGIESTLAVNHLAYFLLTNLLLDRLRASAPARIVSVASDAHRFGKVDLDDLQAEARYKGMRHYGASKGCNILFTYELTRRLEGSGVTANCLHPGGVATGLGSNHGWLFSVISPLLRLFMKTPEQGAATSIYLATSPEVEGVSGRYFASCKEIRSTPQTYDEDVARRLWQESERLTGIAGSS